MSVFDFESLNELVLVEILSFLEWRELLVLEGVSSFFYAAVNREHVWRRAARALFLSKNFVPEICWRLIEPGNSREHREDLQSMPVRRLKLLRDHYGLKSVLPCIEKSDFVNLIRPHEEQKMQPRECLARFAIRAAFLDRKRNCITKMELCSLRFQIRVRSNGPLQNLLHMDPFWQGGSAGTATFLENNCLKFDFGPDYPDHPFYTMGDLTYRIGGPSVCLSVGVVERIDRNPDNWGWFMCSPGTVWTSFPMSAQGMCADDCIEEFINPPCMGFFV